ncbi:uncharacterized protein LOC119719291 [Patiria miniata]|uniref:Saposin B-type domain-containing protein n=1 Tax=Patiria miniata TaxID=46514 RepID=A0A913YYZ3_PATMI|nr:uncharacterized protein LOC119719275 [Patiria miniata]XP_038044622.1 uncharacterized protein LOC119719291 [Patiria miniata]
MDKSVGILVIMFIVAVSGQEYVLTMKQEVQYAEEHDTSASDKVARMIHQLASGIQEIQKLSTVDQAPNFPCMWCEQLMTMAHGMAVDKGLLDLVQTFMRQYACTYLVPAGYKAECNAYVDAIPDLIIAFANTYLNPNNCVLLCQSSEVNQQLNVLGNIVNKMGGAS